MRWMTDFDRAVEAGSGAARPFNDSAPLQAQVEHLPLRFTIGQDKVAISRLTHTVNQL